MKNNRVLVLFITFLSAIMIGFFTKTFNNYYANYSLDFDKKVYVGGDNIVLDYIAASDDDAISKSSEYATVGTISYIGLDGKYGAVGHSLTIDNVKTGNIFIVPVVSVIKSTKIRIGEKNVNYGYNLSDGSIEKIEETGVYGTFTGQLGEKSIVEVGMPKEIKKSEATLYTNIDGNEVKEYKIEIKKVYYTRKNHNILIKIVDKDLLDLTGGVIQGMSGSPIVQNGKIIGALSHVDKSNPEYGYGIFITSML